MKKVSGRFFEKKLRKKLLLLGDVAKTRVKVTKIFGAPFLKRRILIFSKGL